MEQQIESFVWMTPSIPKNTTLDGIIALCMLFSSPGNFIAQPIHLYFEEMNEY
jgi:hypothetical protein